MGDAILGCQPEGSGTRKRPQTGQRTAGTGRAGRGRGLSAGERDTRTRAGRWGWRTLDGIVAVDNAKPSKESHMDGHLVLSHGVHGARDEWHIDPNPFRCIRRQLHVDRIEVDAAWKDDVVAVCVPVAVGE